MIVFFVCLAVVFDGGVGCHVCVASDDNVVVVDVAAVVVNVDVVAVAVVVAIGISFAIKDDPSAKA